MEKDILIKILNQELNNYIRKSNANNPNAHIMSLLINYIENNFKNFSDEEIECLLKFDKPLKKLGDLFIDNQPLDELLEDTFYILLNIANNYNETDDEMNCNEDENGLSNYEN